MSQIKHIKEKNLIYVRRSSKNPWIWKNYIEIQLRQWFYYISFVDVIVITKLKPGSMRIGASPQSRPSRKMTKAIRIRG